MDGAPLDVIQDSKPEPRIMRCEFSEHEWTVIKPKLPNKPLVEVATITGMSRTTIRRGQISCCGTGGLSSFTAIRAESR